MPQQQRAVDTRQIALIGAAVTIDRHGYGAATIAEMVRESRITKGALYFHFPSKEAVAEAIIASQSEWLDRHIEADDAPVQQVVDLSYEFAEALISDPLMRASIRMTVDRAGPSASIAHGYSSWIIAVTELLNRGQAAGTLNDHVVTDDCAFVVTSAITGLQLTSDALSQRQDLAERLEGFWRMILPSIVRPEFLPSLDARPFAKRDTTVGSPG